MSLTINGAQVKKVLYDSDTVKKLYYNDSLVYSGENFIKFIEENGEPFTLKVNSGSYKTWNGTMYYSTNGENWKSWSSSSTEISSSSDGKLFLRGVGNKYVNWYYDGNRMHWPSWILSSNKRIRCEGNIENLLDYKTVEQGNHPNLERGFENMFMNNNSLISAPELPAETSLCGDAYIGMFQYCTNLISPPSTVYNGGTRTCANMFNGCTNLISAPRLLSTRMGYQSCKQMFYYCSNLVSAPELPAKTLYTDCYKDMFYGCSSLTGQIHCASSTATNQYRLKDTDITGSSATIVFDL